jgi:chromosome segregation ATPase
MFGKKKRELEMQLAAERKESRAIARSANDKLRLEIKTLKEKLEDQSDEHKKLIREINRSITKKDEENKNLREDVKVLKELENNRVEQQVTAIELEGKELLLDAREKQFKSFTEELKESKEAADALAEEKYKTGYSDGLADGLRKIHEITAEDRKQAMQVAALAASSHTPEAANIVAEGIRNDMMALPAGKTKKNAKK